MSVPSAVPSAVPSGVPNSGGPGRISKGTSLNALEPPKAARSAKAKHRRFSGPGADSVGSRAGSVGSRGSDAASEVSELDAIIGSLEATRQALEAVHRTTSSRTRSTASTPLGLSALHSAGRGSTTTGSTEARVSELPRGQRLGQQAHPQPYGNYRAPPSYASERDHYLHSAATSSPQPSPPWPHRGSLGRGSPGRGSPGRGSPGRGSPGRGSPGRPSPGRPGEAAEARDEYCAGGGFLDTLACTGMRSGKFCGTGNSEPTNTTLI